MVLHQLHSNEIPGICNIMRFYFSYGKPSVFVALDLRTIVNGLFEARCLSVDLGFTPYGFPFQVYKKSRLDAQKYIKRLEDVGVPQGYEQALSDLLRRTKCDNRKLNS